MGDGSDQDHGLKDECCDFDRVGRGECLAMGAVDVENGSLEKQCGRQGVGVPHGGSDAAG